MLPLFLLLPVLACQGLSEREELYKAAFEKQREVLSALKEVKKQLAGFDLPEKDSLRYRINELEENLFPIPGYPLELPGHEGHDHGHSIPEISAAEMLELQKELLQQLNDFKLNLTKDD